MHPYSLALDSAGFALFYGGELSITSSTDLERKCRHVIADMYLDNEGFAKAITCPRHDLVAVASLGVRTERSPVIDWCAAMYGDLLFDDTVTCN